MVHAIASMIKGIDMTPIIWNSVVTCGRTVSGAVNSQGIGRVTTNQIIDKSMMVFNRFFLFDSNTCD